MYIVPKDSRQRYTKQCITDAFLKALETKQISDISISEISEAAGVSRMTFYKYYSDQFALLRALQEDLLVGFTQELEGLPPNIFDITPVLIRFVARHRVLFCVVIENWSKGGFVDTVINYLYSTYHHQWELANPSMSKNDVEYLFHYVVNGLVGVIHHWLLEDPALPVEAVIERADYLLKLSTPG